MDFIIIDILITLAGLPAMTQLSGTSLTTTLPAPIVTLLPILIFLIIVTEAPQETLLPIIGRPPLLHSIVVQCKHRKLSPIDSALITVALDPIL